MSARTRSRTLLLVLAFALLAVLAGCQAATMAPQQSADPTSAAAEEQPSARPQVNSTNAPAQAEPTRSIAAPTTLPEATAGVGEPQAPAGEMPEIIEQRAVELEWPERLRMGESDVIRLALVPVKDGYVAKAEFPDHSIQSVEVPVPRPNGYTLYAIARLDGVGFEIAPQGGQEHYVAAGEETAWRWTLTPRAPGQQRLSVQLRLRWVPASGAAGTVIESQAYSRGIDVQVASFLGMSTAQAGSTGAFGLLIGGGFLLAGIIGRRTAPAPAARPVVGGVQVVTPNPAVTIETGPNLTLSGEETGLLRGVFAGYSRVVIESEFLSGYSGARTFLVRPVRPDGGADALTIVKLGPRGSIQREFANYEAFVKDRLPPVTARIQRAPVVLGKNGGTKAAVQYTFIASPGHAPVSLRNALLQNPNPALLLRLFETFGPNWWMQRRPYTFRLGVEYDRLLPPHYVLEPVIGSANPATEIDERTSPADLRLPVGAVVRVKPFRQAEFRPDGRSLSLQGLPGDGRPALRLRWQSLTPPGGLAKVTATRMDLLRGWTGSFDRFGLPDPLERLPALLEETVTGTRSVIHGDLNLENVLAGPGDLLWLIDFAETREGHPLFDFAHLESELIAHVLAPRAGSAGAYLDIWQAGNDPLLRAVHEIAQRCLFDSAHPREYDLALYMACVGALKYPNLDPLAKHCLYLTAAAKGATM